MRLPSIEALARGATATFGRFPAPLMAAMAVAVLMLVVVEDPEALELVMRGALAAALLVPTLFAVDVATERGGRAGIRWVGAAAAVACASLFFLASRGWSDEHVTSRFVQLLLAAHLLVAFLPFSRTGEDNAFWQFNRTLFLRFAVATLYTGVLFVGLVVALVSVDTLFDLDVQPENYFRLLIILAFVVHPWIVLSGVPSDVPALESEREYPPALKIFAQFVLIPLVTVYLGILTAYLVRVVVTGEWPSGWIGWLVSSVSAAGTLALLLVHPVRDREENRWVNGYARWFWVLLMPSIVMLFLAVGQRVGQYGFTENRYFLLVLAAWIAVISVYFAITRSREIRWIPVSLCAVSAVTFFGPWGAYSVAERSQVGRLLEMLARSGIPDLSNVRAGAASANVEDEREISAVLRYLFETRGHDPVEALLGADAVREHTVDPAVTGHVDDHGRFADEDAEFTAEFLGLDYVNRWNGNNEYLFVRAWPPVHEVPEGFTHTTRVQTYAVASDTLRIDGRTFRLTLPGAGVVRLDLDGQAALEVDLAGAVRALDDGQTVNPSDVRLPPETLVFEGLAEAAGEESAGGPGADSVMVRLHILSFGGQLVGDSVSIQNVDADLYVGPRVSVPTGGT